MKASPAHKVEALKNRTYSNLAIKMAIQFRLKQCSKQIQTNCTFDLPFILYSELLESVASKKIGQTVAYTASVLIAPFKQNFKNIYRASASNGN